MEKILEIKNTLYDLFGDPSSITYDFLFPVDIDFKYKTICFDTDVVNDACQYGHIDLFKLLYNDTEENEERVGDHARALYYACLGNQMEIINLLLKDTCAIDEMDEMDEAYVEALGCGLIGAVEAGNLNLSKMMIDEGAWDFYEPLIISCEFGHLEIVKLLIKSAEELYADVYFETWDFETGITKAQENNHIEIVNLLQEKIDD